jgi:alkanesulfonate monooxygenase SsuD/methylene tetrahydromethanopterin reductase-like flavin-dependent oxidoreductase (luciferase family)
MDRWGLTLPLPGLTLADHEELIRRAEAAGYTDLWTGETAGPDGFTPLALSAAWTERARLGTGIVGVFQRGPALLAQQAAALADASQGRFVLGIGSSSDRIVEGWNGIPFERPLSKVRETLDFLDVALAGERTESGFKLEQKPAHEVPIVLAALRGKMLELAVERAAGAFTNFLPLAGLPQVTAQLDGAPEGFELLCRFLLHPRRARAGRAARPLHVLLLHHRPGLRQLLPLARLRRADRADGHRLGIRRPPRRRCGRSVGADRRHVNLRHPRADEGAT